MGIWLVDRVGGYPGWGGAVEVLGLLLLAAALAVVGAGLVRSSTTWLRALVAVAFPLLAWSVQTVLRSLGDAVTLDALVGAAAVGLATRTLLRLRGESPQVLSRSAPARGSHASR